jgi:dTDP-4-amino-4,6-dideoxygalactose transaminase
VDEAIAARQKIDAAYRAKLKGVKGIRCLEFRSTRPTFSYFPILVESSYPAQRDALYERLKQNNIFGRRYFYPLISEFPMYRGLPSARPELLPVATEASSKVICLPLYPNLGMAAATRISDLISQWDGR